MKSAINGSNDDSQINICKLKKILYNGTIFLVMKNDR